MVKSNETRKTMRFWIFAGIAAIAVSQLPLLFTKKQQPQEEVKPPQQTKKPLWLKVAVGVLLLGLVIVWWIIYSKR